MKNVRILTTFYRSYGLASLFISAACVALFRQTGWEGFYLLFLFKLFTLGATIAFITSYKKKEFYYYRNLGFSPMQLWIITLLLDLILFIFLIYLSSLWL